MLLITLLIFHKNRLSESRGWPNSQIDLGQPLFLFPGANRGPFEWPVRVKYGHFCSYPAKLVDRQRHKCRRKGDPPGELHFASFRPLPLSPASPLAAGTCIQRAPTPTLVRGCTSPLEGPPSPFQPSLFPKSWPEASWVKKNSPPGRNWTKAPGSDDCSSS